MKDEEVIGKRFGRLTVICRNGNSSNSSKMYLCKCDCGKSKNVIGVYLLDGRTKSCGCLNSELVIKRSKTHGKTKTRLFSIWQNAITRCTNKNCYEYKNYGGRGITICDEWKNDFMSFYNWAMANGYSDKLTIDRIDNNKGYSPENCRWTDNKTQSRNRTDNHFYTYKGETKTIAEWAEIKNMNYKKLWKRIKHNWAEDKIFN